MRLQALSIATVLLLLASSSLFAETPAEGEAVRATAPEIPIKNARQPEEGLLTGGQPTAEQLAEAAAAGYRTVVNLRPLAEQEWNEPAKAAELGLRYVALPVAGADDLTLDNARALAEILDDEANYPVLVHCASSNRVGALFALRAFHLEGKSSDESLEIGRQAGLTSLEAKVRERLVKAP